MAGTKDVKVDGEPYLYILMRTDLRTMNPGKAMAQACHAANQFVFEQATNKPSRSGILGFLSMFVETVVSWMKATPQGFGTTIVLAVNERELRATVSMAKKAGFPAGITHDPSYPVGDGIVAPMDTCGYVFGNKSDLFALVGHYNLHP